jgi:hypothetical protein
MYKFLTAVFTASLLTSTAMAGVKIVEAEVPKSITVVCSNDVKQGTLVLGDPVKINCNDFNLAKSLSLTGITVGPDSNVNRIMADISRAVRKSRMAKVPPWHRGRRNRHQSGEWNTASRTYRDRDGWSTWRPRSERNSLTEQLAPLDDFSKKFPGFNRNREFFVSGTSSCRGWVNLQDILEGRCKDAKVKVR